MEHLLNDIHEYKVWSRNKIRNFCGTKLGVLNHLILGIKLCCFAGKDVGFKFDDTTKRQTKYINLNLSHNYNRRDNKYHPLSDNTDVAMMCVGYDRMYSGNNVGSHFVLTQILTEINAYIQHWNNNECIELLQGSFGPLIERMTFTSIFDRLCAALADRCKVNQRTYDLLTMNCNRLRENNTLYSCSRHDMDDAWVETKKRDLIKHDKQNDLHKIKHGMQINTFVAKLLRPDSKYIRSNS